MYLFQEHPSLRGTPLAMLAAQCNKLSNKSPPPLADAAVGKGFHPWKKSPQGAPSPGTGVSSSSSLPPQRSSTTAGTTYSSRPVMTSCSSVPTSASYGSDLYFPGATTQPTDNSHVHHHQASLLGKVEGTALGSVYSRHPYESWPFNAHHGGIKSDTVASANAWWDVHSTAGSWLDMSGAAGMHAHTVSY